MAFEDTVIVLGHIVCCNGYRGRLRSVMLMSWLMGLADYPSRCFSCYRSMLSTSNVAFSGHWERLTTHAYSVVMATEID